MAAGERALLPAVRAATPDTLVIADGFSCRGQIRAGSDRQGLHLALSDTRTASDVLVDRLLEWGVDTIFGLPGDGINGFVDALRKRHDELRYVHVQHEEVAAMAAVGYAKFTSKLGVCFSTASPGAVHMLNGLLDAKVGQAPILAITGMTYHDLIGTSYLQDVNTDYLFNDVAVYNQRIMGPQHVTNVVDYAVRTALTQRGPSHLAFPIDYQAAPAESGDRFKRNVAGHTSTTYRPPVRVPTRQDLDAEAAAPHGRTRLAILAGAGARAPAPSCCPCSAATTTARSSPRPRRA